MSPKNKLSLDSRENKRSIVQRFMSAEPPPPETVADPADITGLPAAPPDSEEKKPPPAEKEESAAPPPPAAVYAAPPPPAPAITVSEQPAAEPPAVPAPAEAPPPARTQPAEPPRANPPAHSEFELNRLKNELECMRAELDQIIRENVRLQSAASRLRIENEGYKEKVKTETDLRIHSEAEFFKQISKLEADAQRESSINSQIKSLLESEIQNSAKLSRELQELRQSADNIRKQNDFMHDELDKTVYRKIRNTIEETVFTETKAIIKNTADMCKCDLCYFDVCAIALNNVKPHYVTTKQGELFDKAAMLNIANLSKISVEIFRAVDMVKQKPAHAKH